MTYEEKQNTNWVKLCPAVCNLHIERLIDRRNARYFNPFERFAVCYCETEFSRGDVVPPQLHADCEDINYLMTGELDPPQIEDENPERWLGEVGALSQKKAGEKQQVLNMELRLRLPPNTHGGKRWELESEMVPMVYLHGCEVRILAGRFGDKLGPIQTAGRGLVLLDVTLQQGAEFSLPISNQKNTFAYVCGGKADFGRKEPLSAPKHTLLHLMGNEAYATTKCSGVRFFIFSSPAVLEEK